MSVKKIIPTYRIPKNKRIMTTSEHKKDLTNRGIDVIPIGLYMGLEVPMLYRYSCGHEKEMKPAQMKGSNKGRCLICYPNNPPKEHQFTTDEFKEQILAIHPTISIIGEYSRSDMPIDVMCNICKHKWSPIAHTLKQGHGCPKCRYINSRIGKDEFYNRISYWHYDFSVLDIFTILTDYYRCKCNICGYEWKAEGRNLISGKTGCSNCFTNSKGEKLIRKILETEHIKYIPQKTFKDLKGIGGKSLMLDIYIPSFNLIIEFQGIQHEKPVDRFGGIDYLKTLQEHDRRKREYAKQHSIKFLEIWYYDYNNIEQILKDNLNLETVETVREA